MRDMLQVASSPRAKSETKVTVRPLRNGDHLTRQEFERRFDATPGLKKAELIGGIVFVSPPVSISEHGVPQADLITVLGLYRASTPGVIGAGEASVRVDDKNMPQPDLCLFIDPKLRGQAKIDADDYLVGAPDLVAEISATTASIDLHRKFDLYRQAGVREYIVWRTLDSEFDIFLRAGDDFVRVAIPPDGIYRSTVFPGLWIDCDALIAGNLAAALNTVQLGLESPEHTEFTQSLADRAK